MSNFTISGQIVNIIDRKIFPGTIEVKNGKITSIKHDDTITSKDFILPGFIDAHIHIESSMLIPSEFARLASVHGTVATVSDPHEIGNVLGIEGVKYMLDNAKQVPFHFHFGAPSCVPATTFETAGAVIDANGIEQLFTQYGLGYLSEVMNYPGVLHHDPEVMKKIAIAKQYGKQIDGHAPGLRGEDAANYIKAGISTDHECFTLDEALDKIRYGMKILIREGSAAKNYEALHTLIKSHPDLVMFCSDDKHPHELVDGHINLLVKRSIVDNHYDTMDVLRAACYHPIQHYQLEVGLLRPGDSADFIVVNNLRDFDVKATYVKGELIAKDGKTLIPHIKAPVINHFHCNEKKSSDFALEGTSETIKVIKVNEGQLVTDEIEMKSKIDNGYLVVDPERDLLKIVVVNRYQDAPPAIAFIHNFGLKEGAIASCIAHDSHNIVCVGVDDDHICKAVNAIIANKGGISVSGKKGVYSLKLPVAGIMSADDGYLVAKEYSAIDQLSKKLGTPLQAPFMTLSFMALLVIPSLKLSDKGLFDGTRFAFTSLT